MDILLGILPYLYFHEPVRLGGVTFLSVPDWRGRDHAPAADYVKQCLSELSTCFATTRGLSTRKGSTRAVTYFLLESEKGEEARTVLQAHKAVTLLRYAVLRPDAQALDDVESTYVYAFALPHEGGDDYRLYECWPNVNVEQEIWVSPRPQRFPLPGWDVDLQLMHSSSLEDAEEMEQRFCTGVLPEREEAEILLAMEWYNQSFVKYSLRGISGSLVDLATAFETLFQLPRHNKTEVFKKRIGEYLGASEGSTLDNWATDFYKKVRSETLHKGKPLSLLFKHPQAQTPHLSFLWSSRCIFRECISVRAGLPRHIANERLADELTPNEVHLDNLRQAGSLKKILEGGLLDEVERLRSRYPAGKRQDIVWLGKELLRGYEEQYAAKGRSLPTLGQIVQSDDTGPSLGLKYYRFEKEFSEIYPKGYVALMGYGGASEVGKKKKKKKLKPITRANIKQIELESAISHFVRFAGWALLSPQ